MVQPTSDTRSVEYSTVSQGKDIDITRTTFARFISDESAILRMAMVLYQVIGRTLFTCIIIVACFYNQVDGRRVPLLFLVMILAAVWIASSFLTFRRIRLLSRLVAETEYAEDRRVGSLLVKSHHFQYMSSLGRMYVVLLVVEPLSFWLMSVWLILL